MIKLNTFFFIIFIIHFADDHSVTKVAQLLTYDHPRIWNAMYLLRRISEENINFEILTPILKQYDIVTEDEKDYFMSDSNSKQNKVSKLIDCLGGENETKIHNFVKAMAEAYEHTGHNALLHYLHKTATSFKVTAV